MAFKKNVTWRRHPHVPLLRLANANVAEERWQAPSTYKAKVISITEQHIWQQKIHLMNCRVFTILRTNKGNHPVISWECRSLSDSQQELIRTWTQPMGKYKLLKEILMFDQQIQPDTSVRWVVGTSCCLGKKNFSNACQIDFCAFLSDIKESDVIQATYLPPGFRFHTNLLQCL